MDCRVKPGNDGDLGKRRRVLVGAGTRPRARMQGRAAGKIA